MVKLQEKKIDIKNIEEALRKEEVGAIVFFLGEPRKSVEDGKVVSINYTAYMDMALKEMREIENDAKKKFGVKEVVIIHRIGNIPLKEISFLVAVSSAHRNEGFNACRWIVDEVKTKVPIWKEIIYEGTRNN